ncbi:MAG: AtpZ/AtpI family protein [Defluviitaleaceae bacterium]|jgi:F0F1-type ATP synthase assembly protein I|nr:AtpZ/AtpI family protein [Defluviitaleaceae bacterium]
MKLDDEDRKSLAKGLSSVSQLSFVSITCVGLGVLAGYWLDRWTGLSPLFIIILSLCGIIAAIKAMVDFAKKM